MPDDQLHVVESVQVTGTKIELGTHRMRVPGGWIYWLHAGMGSISQFVPDPVAPKMDAPAVQTNKRPVTSKAR